MWGRARSGLAVAALCASCLDVPAHRTSDAGGDGPADAMPDGGRQPLVGLVVTGEPSLQPLTVTGAGFSVQFAAPGTNGVRLPDQIMIGGVDVLGHDTECNGEDGVGLAIFPALTASAQLTGGTSTTLDVLGGAAMVKVTTMWNAPFDCPTGETVNASGLTHFTFYPDGRIVRFDSITPADSPLSTPGDCGCDTSSDFYLTSFLTLADARFTRIRWHDNLDATAEQMPLPLPGWVDDSNPLWACMDDWNGSSQSRSVAVVWDPPAVGTNNNATRLKPDQGNTVLLWDWRNAAASLPATEFTTPTVWYLGDSACDHGTVDTLTAAFTAPPRLTFAASGQPSVDLDLDRAHGWYFYDPSPRPDPVSSMYTLTPVDPILPGFAVSLLLPKTDKPMIRRNGGPLIDGFDYLTQEPEVIDTDVWRHRFWFPDSLNNSATITVIQP